MVNFYSVLFQTLNGAQRSPIAALNLQSPWIPTTLRDNPSLWQGTETPPSNGEVQSFEGRDTSQRRASSRVARPHAGPGVTVLGDSDHFPYSRKTWGHLVE